MTSQAEIPYGLHGGFLASAQRWPDRPALELGDEVLDYAALRGVASRIAVCLQSAEAGPESAEGARVGVLAHRSVAMYAGILGTLMAGCVLVPLNPGFPAQRSAAMVRLSGARSLVVDAAGLAVLPALLTQLEERAASAGTGKVDGLHIVLAGRLQTEAEAHAVAALVQDWPQHRFVTPEEAVPVDWQPVSVAPDSLACVFFTSGSTGVPKGVGVLHRNALRFVDMSRERYGDAAPGLSEQDRFSQFYDITFDSSMFDLYVSWAFGACLCCPTAFEWVNPNKFIEARRLTVVDFVPSTGHAMNRGDAWRAGRFAGLRLCRFGGEALSAGLAARLAEAAPHAVVENVYGPTECTVDAAYYRWERTRSPAECEHGIVPIGYAGNQVGLLVVDEHLQEVAPGEAGELLISGPQVTPGYWQDPARTASVFIQVPGRSGVHYRTGDLVRRPADSGPIVYLGRMDQQIKISGVRIELGEIEQALCELTGAELAVAVGWPLTDSGASGVVAFVAGVSGQDPVALREALKQRLPAVMVPKAIHFMADFPLNVNGKIDRKALLESLG